MCMMIVCGRACFSASIGGFDVPKRKTHPKGQLGAKSWVEPSGIHIILHLAWMRDVKAGGGPATPVNPP